MTRACETCEYLGLRRTSRDAVCRRNAPVALPGGNAIWPAIGHPADEWCGQWQRREPGKD